MVILPLIEQINGFLKDAAARSKAKTSIKALSRTCSGIPIILADRKKGEGFIIKIEAEGTEKALKDGIALLLWQQRALTIAAASFLAF